MVTIPEMEPVTHEIAARECDAIAEYLESRHRMGATAIRVRAERHRTAAKIPLDRRLLIKTALGSDEPDEVAEAMAKLDWSVSP